MSRRLRTHALALLLVGLVFAFASSALAAPAPTNSMASPVATEATPTPLPVFRLEDDDVRSRFSGSWLTVWRSQASGQTYRRSAKAGSYSIASFEGTGVALIASKVPNGGRARIYVDGVATATVSFYAPSAGTPQVVWQSAPLPEGAHSVKVVVLGTRESGSSGYFVPIDALEITGRLAPVPLTGTIANNGNRKLARVGTWSTSTRAGAISGSSWRAGKEGKTVIVRFKGTSIAWLGRKDAVSGKAAVFLDGKRVATISQYRSVSAERRVAWSISGLANREHTLQIKVLGEKTASSGGTYVDLDAFRISGTLLQAYRPAPFSYPWSTYIVIDKSSFRLYWVRNGMLIKTYPIAHGKASTPTPNRVWRIDAKYYTDPSSVYGPRKMRLFKQVRTSNGYRYDYTNYAIHGTNQPWVIGTMASHGCIRMYNTDVLELWPQVPLGTMVVTRD